MDVIAVCNVHGRTDKMKVFHDGCPLFSVLLNDISKCLPVDRLQGIVLPLEFVLEIVVKPWDGHCFAHSSFHMTGD